MALNVKVFVSLIVAIKRQFKDEMQRLEVFA
jgi:hypothetical protein